MAVLAGFTIEAGRLRSLVSAWLAVQDDIYWVFTREDLHGRAMGYGRARAVEFGLFPLDYRSEVDRVWVHIPGEMFAKTVRRFKLRGEVRVELRDDDKVYVGPFKVGDVVEEEDVFEDFKPPKLKVRVDARLKVVTADFRRIVKRAAEEKTRDYIVKSVYEHTGIKVKAPEATIIFFNKKHSRMDLKGYEPWVVRIEGDAKSVYSLPLFSSLVVLGLTDILDISFQEKGVMEFSYPGSDFWLKFWLAPKVNKPQERFEELLVARPPVRKELWILRGDDVKLLEKTVRATDAVCRGETFNVGMLHDLVFYWKEYDKGYFHVSRGRFWSWNPPAERMSGVFNIAGLARWLKGVEDLTCLLEGEPPEAFVLLGKGAKIAPKELRSTELVKEIEVPEVRGIEVFSGPSATLRDVLAEAEAAGEAFLIFRSSPYEIEVLGRDIIYYRAALPVDAFKMIEEDYVAVNEAYFRGLSGFFTSFPAPYVTIGKDDDNIYLKAESTLGELRALVIQTDTEVEEALKFYKEEVLKPPPAPPEVKLPPPVPPPPPPPVKPPPIEYAEVRFLKECPAIVGADMKTYGPFKAGDIERLPKENADILVHTGVATYELVPPKPPPPVVSPPPVVPPEKRPLKELPKEVETIRERLIKEAEEVFSAYKIWEYWVRMRDDVVSMIDAVIRKYWHMRFVEAERNIHREFMDRIHEEFVKKLRPPPPPKPPKPPPEVRPPPPPKRPPYPYLPVAMEVVELEPDFKEFLKECGITMEDYRRLEAIGRHVMREEYRRWKARPYSS